MNLETSIIKGHLVNGKEEIPVDVKYSSKHSVSVRFLNENPFRVNEEFSKLVIDINDTILELGPCRLISEPNIDGYTGRLVFTEEVYDIERLFSDGKLIRLQDNLLNLPLLLSHKDKIRQSFKDYTANLAYDLNVYKNLFDEVDAEINDAANEIQKSIQEAIINTEGIKFMRFLDDKLGELNDLVADFTKDEHERHGFYFRKVLWNIIMCSSFMKRTNLKPREYAGDSEMFRMIYLNEYEGESIFSKLMNKHPLEHAGAQAVRNRRKIVSETFRRLANKYHFFPQEKIKVLSVGCGPAFELQDILLSPEDCRRYHFILLDQDRHALYEAATLVTQIENRLNEKVKAVYMNASVRTMLRPRRLIDKWGRLHFIYCMGLFDYLTPPVAAAVLRGLYKILKPEGEILIGNFHASNPSRYYMEYWNDWVVYHRNEEEFVGLAKETPSAEVSLHFDDTRIQMFLNIKKLEK